MTYPRSPDARGWITIARKSVSPAGPSLGPLLAVATGSCASSDAADVFTGPNPPPPPPPVNPTLTALVVTPSSITLAPGDSQQFTVSGSWSDGSSAQIG